MNNNITKGSVVKSISKIFTAKLSQMKEELKAIKQRQKEAEATIKEWRLKYKNASLLEEQHLNCVKKWPFA